MKTNRLKPGNTPDDQKPGKWTPKDFFRTSVRALALSVGVFAVASNFAPEGSLFWILLSTIAGVFAGEAWVRRSLRFQAAIVAGGAWVLFIHVCAGLVESGTWSRAFGPPSSLYWSAALRFSSYAFVIPFVLRVLSHYRSYGVVVELGLMSAAISLVFAGHRNGMLARPLWLSDWAWSHDLEPSQVLIALGSGAALLLLVLLLVETKSKRAPSTLVFFGILSVAALLFLRAKGKTHEAPASDVPGISSNAIKPPDPPPDGGGSSGSSDDGGGGSGSSDDGGGGGSGSDAESDGGGGGSSDAQSDGGGGGESDAQSDGGGGSSDASSDAPSPPTPPPTSRPDQESDQENKGPPPNLAVVVFEDDYDPPFELFYFREEVWSEFRAPYMRPSSNPKEDVDTLDHFPNLTETLPDPPKKGRRKIGTKVSLMSRERFPFALETPVVIAPAENPNPETFVMAYHVDSWSLTATPSEYVGHAAGDPTWTSERKAYYLTKPADPRWKTLTDKLVAELPAEKQIDPFYVAVKLKTYVEKTIQYSPKENRHKSSDPLGESLFGDHVGQMNEIAQEAALLFRTAEIPSRIAVGYSVDASRRKGSSLVIQGGDGRLWPEIYLDAFGWIPLEVVPEKILDPKKTPPPDEESQRKLGEQARKGGTGASRGKSKGSPSFGPEVFLFLALLALLVVAIVVLGAKVWRRWIWHFVRGDELPRVAYRTAVDRLSDLGLRRQPGETREEFAKRASLLCPSFVAMTKHHVAGLLRGPYVETTRPEFQSSEWRTLLREQKTELRANTKFLRRFLGAVNPITLFRTR